MRDFQWAFSLSRCCQQNSKKQPINHRGCHHRCLQTVTAHMFLPRHSRLHDRTTRVQLPSKKLPIILYKATACNAALGSRLKVYLLYHHHAIMHLHRIGFAQRTLKQFHMGKKATMWVPNPKVMKKHSKVNRKKKKSSDFQHAQRPGQSPLEKDSLFHLLSPSDHPWGAGMSSLPSGCQWWAKWIWMSISVILVHQWKLAL